MPFLRKYGTGTGADVIVPIIKAGEVNHAVSADWTPATGDVKVSKDGGAAANIGTLPAYITSIGWKFVFADAELQCARLSVQVTDSATKAVEDQHFTVETYGNASAQHAMDFDDSVRAGLTALPNAAADAAGGLSISDAGGLDLDAKLAETNEITAARMGALTDLLDDGRLDVLIDAIKAKTDNLPVSPAAVGSQMGLADGAVTAAKLASNTITAAKIADDAITSAKLAADSIGNSQLATSAVSEIQSGLATADKLLAYVQLLARKDAAIATDNSTELGEINADGGSGAGGYDNADDSVQAVRDQGDSAWATATGFATAGDQMDLVDAPNGAAVTAIQNGLATASALATVDTVVDSILADTGTDGVVLSTATKNAIATALLDLADGVEPGSAGTERTVREALRLILSAVVGKLAGAATTSITIRDTNDSKNRISATVDADGNRTAVTLDDT